MCKPSEVGLIERMVQQLNNVVDRQHVLNDQMENLRERLGIPQDLEGGPDGKGREKSIGNIGMLSDLLYDLNNTMDIEERLIKTLQKL